MWLLRSIAPTKPAQTHSALACSATHHLSWRHRFVVVPGVRTSKRTQRFACISSSSFSHHFVLRAQMHPYLAVIL